LDNCYFETLDENFNEALNLIEKQLTHEELIKLLEFGNIPQKQLAALRLDTLNSENDAKILIDNLTGQDGKIREAVSLKIKEFSSDTKFLNYILRLNVSDIAQTYLDAITDINGNICRNIIESLCYYKNNLDFTNQFNTKLVKLIYELLEKIKDFDFKDGKYKVNKEVFKLYWCLEAAYVNFNTIPINDLKKIIAITKDIDEYTIREKTAKILSNSIDDNDLVNIKSELQNDKNFYVRRALL